MLAPLAHISPPQAGRRARRALALLAALITVALAAGCGGSSTPTKASFTSKANAICSSLEQALKEASGVRVQGGLEAKLEEGVKTIEHATAELRKIPLPPHETVPREWLRYREAVIAAARRVIDAPPSSPLRKLAAEEEFKNKQKAAALARSYGLDACLTS